MSNGATGTGITFTINAKTAAAAADLQKFFAQFKKQLGEAGFSLDKTGESADKGAKSLGNSRVAMMELGHVARATATSLAAGISPMQVLQFESIRVVQAISFLGIGLSTLLPALAAVATPVALGVLGWRAYHEEERKAREETERLNKELKAMPSIVEKLSAIKDYTGGRANEALVSIDSINSAFLEGKFNLKEYRAQLDNIVKLGYLTKTGNGDDATYNLAPKVAAVAELKKLRNELQQDSEVEGGDQKKITEQFDLMTVRARSFYDVAKASGAAWTEEQQAELLKMIETAKQRKLDQIDYEAATKLRARLTGDALSLAQTQSKIQTNALARQEQELTSSLNTEYGRRINLAEDYFQKLRDIAEKEASAASAPLLLKRQQNHEEQVAAQVEIDNQTEPNTEKRAALQQRLADLIAEERNLFAALNDIDQKRLQKIDAIINAVNQHNQELEHQRQAEMELQLRIAQAHIQEIENDPTLTEIERKKKLTEAINKENELIDQQIDYYNKLADAKARAGVDNTSEREKALNLDVTKHSNDNSPVDLRTITTWSGQWRQLIKDLNYEWSSWAYQGAKTFREVYASSFETISSGIKGLIHGTMTWTDMLRNIGLGIMNQLIDAVVDLGIEFVKTHLLQRSQMIATHTLGLALQAKELAISIANAAKNLVAWLPSAIATAIASYGTAAIVGLAAVIAAVGALSAYASGAFEEGGYTGNIARHEVAGVVHGQEYVLDAETTSRIGIPALDALRAGGSLPLVRGGSALLPQSTGRDHTTDIRFVVVDSNEAARRWANSEEGELWFLNLLDRNAQRYKT